MAVPYCSGPVSLWAIVPDPIAIAQANAIASGGLTTGGIGRGSGGGLSAATALVIANLAKRPVFLGTGERAPNILARRAYTSVFNDITGDQVPLDKQWQGEEHFVSVVLTRWNEGVYRAMAALPRPGGDPGGDGFLDRGSLMVTEGLAYPLLLRFGHADKAIYAANGMPPGVRYYAAYLEGQDRHEPGTSVNRRHLMFYCANVYNPATGAIGLFDYNVSALPAIPPD